MPMLHGQEEAISPEIDNLVKVFQDWKPSFFIKFDLKIESFKPQKGGSWGSVIHFTSTDNMCCNVGDRVPALFTHSDGYLHHCMAINDNGNKYYNEFVDQGKWYTIEYNQFFDSPKKKWTFQIKRDGVVIFSHQLNEEPPKMDKVKMFIGNENPADVKIKNLEHASWSECPSDWYPYGAKCYKAFEIVEVPVRYVGWEGAQQYCIDQGGILAVIKDQNTNNMLNKIVNGRSSWIGGFRIVQVGQLMWTDGSFMTYQNWDKGQPDNYGGDEYCVQFNYPYSYSGKWNDMPCGRGSGGGNNYYVSAFICQKDQI